MSTFNRKKWLIPIAILLFPVVFWLVLTTGKNEFRELPVIGPLRITDTGDTLVHRIPVFSMVNQEGVLIDSTVLHGKILIAGFFNPGDTLIGRDLNYQMSRLQSRLNVDTALRLLSISLSPLSDASNVLKSEAATYAADPKFWYFLTTSADSLELLIRDGFLIPWINKDNIPANQFAGKLWLIDKERQIRGQYDAQELTEMDSLIGDLKVLRLQYHIAAQHRK